MMLTGNIKKQVINGYPYLILLSAALIVFPMNIYILVLLQSLALHVITGYIICGLIAAWRKKWRIVTACGAAAILILIQVLPHFHFSKKYNIELQSNLKVAHFNVLLFNENHEKTISKAKEAQADIISFQEVDKDWYSDLSNALNTSHPHHLYVPDKTGYFGVVIFSKHPIHNSQKTFFKSRPVVEADLIVDNQIIHLITTHTSSPSSPNRMENRNKALRFIAGRIKSNPTLIIGDFNTVPWDDNLTQITQKVNDSRNSFGGTYPNWLPFGRIPIDYILHSGNLECVKFETIGDTDSDHLGIVSSFHLNNTSNVAHN